MNHILIVICAFSSLVAIYFAECHVNKKDCISKSEFFEDVKYTFLDGCEVKHNGKWLRF